LDRVDLVHFSIALDNNPLSWTKINSKVNQINANKLTKKTKFSSSENLERRFENVKKISLPYNPSLNFVHNFLLEACNLKQVSRDEFNVIF